MSLYEKEGLKYMFEIIETLAEIVILSVGCFWIGYKIYLG